MQRGWWGVDGIGVVTAGHGSHTVTCDCVKDRLLSPPHTCTSFLLPPSPPLLSDFKNKRASFITEWWSIVNWNQIEENYQSFLTYDAIMTEMAEKRQAKANAAAAASDATPAADAKDL